MLLVRKIWSFTIFFYKNFHKGWSQYQKVGVKLSKFGVSENSDTVRLFVCILCTNCLQKCMMHVGEMSCTDLIPARSRGQKLHSSARIYEWILERTSDSSQSARPSGRVLKSAGETSIF